MKFLSFLFLLTFAIKVEAAEFIISSPDFKPNDTLSSDYEFNGFGCARTVTSIFSNCDSNPNRFKGLDCTGKNLAPTITWDNPPAETRSFALTVFDPDVQNRSGWWNYIVYDIPLSVRVFKDGLPPRDAIISTNDGGFRGYMGFCPARGSGKHRYIFTIYALDVDKLDVPQSATPGLVSYVLNQHKIATSSIVVFYERKK